MNENMIFEKFIEMIKGDLLGASINLKDKGMITSLSFKYDKKDNLYKYSYYTLIDSVKDEVNGELTNEEEVLNLINSHDLYNVMTAIVERRLEKEQKYSELREQSISAVNEMRLDDVQKNFIISVIEKVTQLSEVVGMGNRVYFVNTPDYKEHIRVTDSSKWQEYGDELHLQLVQVMETPNGKQHNYPDMTFEELVGFIRNSPLMKREEHRKGL